MGFCDFVGGVGEGRADCLERGAHGFDREQGSGFDSLVCYAILVVIV